jgi:hypothetical protein
MKVRKLFASLLVLIFAILTIPTLFIQSITSTYLNPDFYQGPVVDKSYDYLISVLSDEVGMDEDVKQYLTASDIKEVISTHFQKEAFQEVIQDFMSQMKTINGDRGGEKISVSLMPLKENIEPLSADVAERIVSKIPSCETDDLESFNNVDGLPSCIPPQISRTEIEDPIKREIKRAMQENIPDNFSPVIESSIGESEQEVKWPQIFSFFQYIHLILPLFLLILLLLMMLIIYKPHTTIMKFVGAAFTIGGVFSIMVAQIFVQIPTYIPTYEVGDIEEVRELYTFLISFITDKMTTYSLYFIGVGLVIFLLGIYLKKHLHIQQSLES